MRRVAAGMTLALALAGCATPYQDMGYRGGVKVIQVDAHTFMVQSQGNAYTDKTMVVLYAVRRAAEQTLANGDEWFRMKGATDSDRRETVVVPGSSTGYTNASVMGTANMATGMATTNTYSTPGYVETYFKPGAVIVFESGAGPRPERAKDAREVLKYLVPQTGG